VALDTIRVFLRSLGADAYQLVGLFHRTAVMADRAIRPQHTLDMLESGGFVAEVRA
jgi:hypothetical protein